jgi:NADPH-dependent 2,4-dienoyl-CoA reductase/sulfur reductase-like enzyme
LDRHPWAALDPSRLPLSCWAVTDRRLVGRLSSGVHTGWTWDQVGAYQANLQPSKEWASVVVDGRPTLFYGPGVAPLAVALVWRLHGAVALLEHPGLVPLRVRARPREAEEPMLALPAHNELEDLLRGL